VQHCQAHDQGRVALPDAQPVPCSIARCTTRAVQNVASLQEGGRLEGSAASRQCVRSRATQLWPVRTCPCPKGRGCSHATRLWPVRAHPCAHPHGLACPRAPQPSSSVRKRSLARPASSSGPRRCNAKRGHATWTRVGAACTGSTLTHPHTCTRACMCTSCMATAALLTGGHSRTADSHTYPRTRARSPARPQFGDVLDVGRRPARPSRQQVLRGQVGLRHVLVKKPHLPHLPSRGPAHQPRQAPRRRTGAWRAHSLVKCALHLPYLTCTQHADLSRPAPRLSG